MTQIQEIEQRISDYKKIIARLEEQIKEIQSAEVEQRANINAYNACFDGLKFVADANNPFTLAIPMKVKSNMFYAYNGKVYVCTQEGICTDTTFADLMTEWGEETTTEGTTTTEEETAEPIELVMPMNVEYGKHYYINDGIKNIQYICIQSGYCEADVLLDFMTPSV